MYYYLAFSNYFTFAAVAPRVLVFQQSIDSLFCSYLLSTSHEHCNPGFDLYGQIYDLTNLKSMISWLNDGLTVSYTDEPEMWWNWSVTGRAGCLLLTQQTLYCFQRIDFRCSSSSSCSWKSSKWMKLQIQIEPCSKLHNYSNNHNKQTTDNQTLRDAFNVSICSIIEIGTTCSWQTCAAFRDSAHIWFIWTVVYTL